MGAQSAPRLYQCGRAWRGAYLHCICYTFKAPRSGPMAPRARRSIPVEHWSTVCTRLSHPTSVQPSAPGAPINSWSPGALSTVSCRQRPTLPSLRRSGWRHNSWSASGRRGHCWMTLRCLTAAGDTRLDSFDASHFRPQDDTSTTAACAQILLDGQRSCLQSGSRGLQSG